MSKPSTRRDLNVDETGVLPSSPDAAGMGPIRDRFVSAWRSGESPRIEEYLHGAEEERRNLLLQLLREELTFRKQAGEQLTIDPYHLRFPDDRETIAKAFALTIPESKADLAFDFASHWSEVTHYSGPGPVAPPSTAAVSDRYRKLQKLGEGAFGAVWLAEDIELQRQVALKEPRVDRLQNAADIEKYLAEARVLASLDHPHIVPVYDVGRTADGSCYVVSKLIDGMDLADYARDRLLPFDHAALLLSNVADALQHTHNRGLVHRDIKPANILVDGQGRPYVADFGLAMREEDFGKRQVVAGTPAYMSPEQARGEGHLIDGRSDIFSLGVVLYELLTGSRPFSGSSWQEMREQITSFDPAPPRQCNETIPVELERICLKALSKRAIDRYACAADLADDLRHWMETPSSNVAAVAARVVPKGLRSFDAADSDFFLDLLPGPRDRDGLPETLRFWKTRMEETDPEKTFRVGLVYGASGCGKSSMLKAGLLPRLRDHLIRVFLEATPDRTEQQLLQALRRACPDLPRNASLVETLTALRRGQGIPTGRKVLLVLDQFEQWLHAHGSQRNTELAAALRQCDGHRIQTVLLVRDDFWMPVSEFLRELEIPLLEGINAAAVSLFDLQHAKKVLAEFGKAFGRLPDNLGRLTPSQHAFLDQAVSGLAQDGAVICVRLALFADMMKNREWTPTSLQAVGGTAGVGATFLEETFSSRTALPQHRRHQEAARIVLRALLPQTGSDIKGHNRTAAELRDSCGYAGRPDDFAELIRILDSEVRLITPVTADGQDPAYQLTHDYLVPSLRDWLNRKQRETRRGRAEVLLEERSASWNAQPANRYLPSLLEDIRIRVWTRPQQWTASQRTMMATSMRVHGIRSTLAACTLIAIVAIGLAMRTNMVRQQEITRMRGLVSELINAEPSQAPGIAEKLAENPAVAASFLSPYLASTPSTPDEKRAKLHARLATVWRDPSLIEPLIDELLNGKISYVIPIRQVLQPSATTLTDRFWKLLRDKNEDPKRRFRAALALAEYIPNSSSTTWTEGDLKLVAEQLVSENAEFQPLLRQALWPIREKLLTPLEEIFGAVRATDAQRLGAANAFADYTASDITKLSQLLASATPEQDAVLFPLVSGSPTRAGLASLASIAATKPPDELGAAERIAFGQRRANAAVTLLRLGQREQALPAFEMTDDPEAISQFIFRCRPRGVGADALLDCLQSMSTNAAGLSLSRARHALLLALGEFQLEEIPKDKREGLLTQLADWYANDPSSGVHGAAGWLLRQWGQNDVVSKVDQTPVPYAPDREWFTLAIDVMPTPAPNLGAVLADSMKKTFYYTFIVFPAGESWIGSPADEPDRSTLEGREQRHRVTLSYSFAVLDREVTMEELATFDPSYHGFMQQAKAQPADAGFGPGWYNAVDFCRWLGAQSGLAESDQAYELTTLQDESTLTRPPPASGSQTPRDLLINLKRRGFRLPTEAEWEIAARGGVRTTYGYGSEPTLLNRFGWFSDNSGKRAHPPKQLRPTLRGAFDLHGNLAEWTHDWFRNEFAAEADTDPVGSMTSNVKVYRGGSWGTDAANCRLANRYAYNPVTRTADTGFRLVVTTSMFSSDAKEETKE